MSIYLYLLYNENEVMYVGLTRNIKQRKKEHKLKKPPHNFVIAEVYTEEELELAKKSEIDYISKYNTYKDFQKWNKTLGGDFDNQTGAPKGHKSGRKKGSIPWNKGLKSCNDVRVKNNSISSVKARKERNSYKGMGKNLPILYGDDNPAKRSEVRNILSKQAMGRKRKYREDGTWYWCRPQKEIIN
jgi:predicted GIY-YIG superfamily endonuclease